MAFQFSMLISTLGVGRLPKAPGTWGSLLALLIWWAFMPANLWVQASAIIIAFVVGTIATAYYEKLTQNHDPKEVVVDELVGMWITLFAAPFDLQILLFGFALFRLFDILKPFPIGWLDRKVPGAFGTMLDDVAAGLISWLLLQGLVAWGGSL
jgi:phosphatidylglycerophosphatase A